MQIINLNGYFSLNDCPIFFKINRIQAVDDIDKLCKFYENLTTNADCITETRNANFQLKMATFPLLIVQFFFSKSIKFKLLMRGTNSVSFAKIRPKM